MKPLRCWYGTSVSGVSMCFESISREWHNTSGSESGPVKVRKDEMAVTDLGLASRTECCLTLHTL